MSSLIRPSVNADRFPQHSAMSQPMPAATEMPDQVLRTAGLRTDDHVVVIGRRTLEHMIAFSRHDCRSAIAIHPDRPLPAIAAADVMWLADGAKVAPKLMSIIQTARDLRTVIVELTGSEAGYRLPLLLEDLRFEGFVQVSSYELSGRRLVVATRPDWLRRVV